MLLRYRHPTTANVEYHRGQAILAGKVRLEILSLGTRVTRRQDPDAIGDFVIGTLLEPQHELLRVCSAHTLRQADPVAEPLLIHEIDVVLGGVQVEPSEHHVVRRGKQLSTVLGLDPDDHAVVWVPTDVLDGR